MEGIVTMVEWNKFSKGKLWLNNCKTFLNTTNTINAQKP
jgi:hypothetical protein